MLLQYQTSIATFKVKRREVGLLQDEVQSVQDSVGQLQSEARVVQQSVQSSQTQCATLQKELDDQEA
jgi:hypothetical protein